MKNTGICPQCASRNVSRVEGQQNETSIIMGMGGFLTSVPVARYVCCNCGFVEQWIESPEDLARIQKKFKTYAPKTE